MLSSGNWNSSWLIRIILGFYTTLITDFYLFGIAIFIWDLILKNTIENLKDSCVGTYLDQLPGLLLRESKRKIDVSIE